MFIAFKPELSFYATLHWEMHSGQPAVHALSATYLEQAPTALDNGWVYASVGDTYSGLKPIGLGLSQIVGRLVTLKFWFACYYCEEGESHRYRYELIAYDDQQTDNPFQFYSLQVSRNGYLAVYQADPPGPGGGKGPLWKLAGLDPWDIKNGGSFAHVGLISPAGKPVRRKMEDYFPYLSDQEGHEARFTVKLSDGQGRWPW